MGYGITEKVAGQQSRTTDYTVETAELLDEENNVIEFHTSKAISETTEEVILQKNATFENEAIAGQVGTEVVTGMTLTEEVAGYAKYTIKSKKTEYAPPTTP